MDNLKEEIVSKERKFDGVVIDVEHWQVRLPDGSLGLREVALHKGAAAVVPVDEQGACPWWRQFRAPDRPRDAGDPRRQARPPRRGPGALRPARALRGDGLTAESVTKLVALRTTPGFCNETIHLYMARGLTQGERHLDEDEFLNVEWVPLEELTDRIVRGEIEDAKTIAALLMAREILRREREA